MIGWYEPGSIPEYCSKVSKRTVETWIRDEGLRFVKIRGKRFVKKEWLDEFLEAHESDHGGAIDRIVSDVCKELNV